MSGRADVPFMQCACVHRNEKFAAFSPLSGYRMWLPEDEDRTLFLRPDATDEALGQALLETLSMSRFIHPTDDQLEFFKAERYVRADEIWHNNLMKRFGFRTLRQLYAKMAFCKVTRAEGKILIKPHRRDVEPRYWWDLPPEMTAVIDATQDPAAVGAALSLALGRCQ